MENVVFDLSVPHHGLYDAGRHLHDPNPWDALACYVNDGGKTVGIGRPLEEMEPYGGGIWACGRETKLGGAVNIYVYDR